jgi:serine/threonine-protein kinase TTK/MPS1
VGDILQFCIGYIKFDFLLMIIFNISMYLKKWNHENIQKINYNDIEFIRKMGDGSSSEIWLVSVGGIYMSSKEYYPYDDGNVDYDDFDYELQNCRKLIGINHIIQLRGYSKKGKRLFILFDNVNCVGDLFTYIRQGCFRKNNINIMSISLKKKIIISLIEAVHNMHINKMVHCDLKPENLLFGKGNVTIIDLGASLFMGDNKNVDSSDKWIRGTPGYMAPELYNKQIYYESDIYSIGVIIIDVWNKIQWGNTNSYNGCLKKTKESLININDKNIRNIAEKCLCKSISLRPSLDTILRKIRD